MPKARETDGRSAGFREADGRARVLKTAFKAALTAGFPGIVFNPEWYYRVHLVDDGFIIDTNIDFFALNKLATLALNKEVNLSKSSLANWLHVARGDLFLASQYMSEMTMSAESAAIIRLKLADILYRHESSTREISLFQEHVLGNARAIREAINSGRVTFSDGLRLVEKARKFKGWLAQQHPDERLLSQYYEAATTETWAEKLPAKSTRFFLITGAGVAMDLLAPTGVGTAMGLSLGAADQFVLDRLLRGWRPNQFIDEEVKPIVCQT